ncbi:uncharacterized protein LOC143207388 [Lasioglossum baleicum]|uniref:uncharacterized protein LOC143207388 n=1 Tax=Lasioglossum baleicum TaxID=434251 RepID=UPI003FCE4A74
MNFVLIPFFLAATIIVDDPTKWQYGLVAHYHANITLNSGANENAMELVNMTTTFTCRQRSMDELICSFPEILLRKPEFLVKFNKNGMENFSFQEVVGRRELSVIRFIMKELSVGVDLLQHANSLSAFVVNQSYVLHDCSTLFTVLQDLGSPTFTNFGKKRDYVLDVLSIPQRKPGANVIIEKRTNSKWCNRTSEDNASGGMSLISEKSVTKMHIGGNTFVSLNKLTAKTRQMRENHSFITEITTYVELAGVEPATEELPPMDDLTQMAMLSPTDARLIYNFVPTDHFGRIG